MEICTRLAITHLKCCRENRTDRATAKRDGVSELVRKRFAEALPGTGCSTGMDRTSDLPALNSETPDSCGVINKIAACWSRTTSTECILTHSRISLLRASPGRDTRQVTMAVTLTSHLKVGESIIRGPLAITAAIPGSANLFPKMPKCLNKSASEAWIYHGVAGDGSEAITVTFCRDAEGAPAGFRVKLNANWVDGTTWSEYLYFPESLVTSEGPDEARGRVVGVWRSDTGRASFEVTADLRIAVVTFEIPGKVNGTMTLTASPGDNGLPKTVEDAKMAPKGYYLRPIAACGATTNITFHKTNKILRMQLDEKRGAFGGCDRTWQPVVWQELFIESWFLLARVGPYVINLLCLIDTPARGGAQHVTASLYRDGELVCAARAGSEETAAKDRDTVVVAKLYDGEAGEGEGAGDKAQVAGTFRDKNVGRRFEFVSRDGRRWSFEALHIRTWWGRPTSKPGPEGTGNNGFVDSVVGGLVGAVESFHGVGIDGQVELPS